MKVNAEFRESVNINPIDVIEELISKEIGSQGWIFIENGICYKGWEASAGMHGIDMSDEITQETYDHVAALKLVLANLKEQHKVVERRRYEVLKSNLNL